MNIRISSRSPLTLKSLAVAGLAATCAGLGLLATAGIAQAATPAWLSNPDGWTVVALSSVTGSYSTPTGPVTLAMVGPSGQQVVIGSLPQGSQVMDLSNDGRRVLVRSFGSSYASNLTVYDTVTRTSKKFSVADLWDAKFTNPTGTNLLTTTGAATTWQRRDLAGVIQARFAGASSQQNLVQSTDGSLVVGVTTGKRISVSSNASGAMLRSYATPGGRQCQPVRAHDASSMVVTCLGNNSSEVFRLNTSTGSWTSLSAALPKQPYGYVSAIPTAKGLAVAKTPSCGPAEWGWASGSRWTKIPRTGETRSLIAFHAGGQRALIAVEGCDPGNAGVRLVSQSTSTTTGDILLAGGTKNPGKKVIGYQAVDRNN